MIPRRIDVVVCGVGGMGREAAALVQAATDNGAPWRLLGFLDDDPRATGDEINDLPVIGSLGWIADRRVAVVLAVGNPRQRRQLWLRAVELGADLPAFVHPNSHVGPYVAIGPGAIICDSAVLTANITVRQAVIVNVGATISHDVVLDDFATLAPGIHLAGAVRVGEGAEIGVGASAIPSTTIGAWSVVGAGAVVTRDIPAEVTAVGVPARPASNAAGGRP